MNVGQVTSMDHLPANVILSIVGYLPRYTQLQLLDDAFLGHHLARTVFSKVIIDVKKLDIGCMINSAFRGAAANLIPDSKTVQFVSVDEFLRFSHHYPNFCNNHIHFTSHYGYLSFVDKCPKELANFTTVTISSLPTNLFIEPPLQFAKLGPNVKALDVAFHRDFSEAVPQMNELKLDFCSFSMANINRFSGLKRLILTACIVVGADFDITVSLEYYSSSEGQVHSPISFCNLPLSLKHLTFSWTDLPEYFAEISRFVHLQKLEISFKRFHESYARLLLCDTKYPLSLQTLRISDVGDHYFQTFGALNSELIPEVRIPSLKSLILTGMPHLCFDVDVKFPDLGELHLSGIYGFAGGYKLPTCIKKLSLTNVKSYRDTKLSGKVFPHSLRSLTIIQEGLELTDMSRLRELTEFHLECESIDVLPPNLVSLNIQRCNVTSFNCPKDLDSLACRMDHSVINYNFSLRVLDLFYKGGDLAFLGMLNVQELTIRNKFNLRLPPFRNSSNVKKLELNGFVIKNFDVNINRLEHLLLADCDIVANQIFDVIAASNLQSLSLRMTDANYHEFASLAFPQSMKALVILISNGKVLSIDLTSTNIHYLQFDVTHARVKLPASILIVDIKSPADADVDTSDLKDLSKYKIETGKTYWLEKIDT